MASRAVQFFFPDAVDESVFRLRSSLSPRPNRRDQKPRRRSTGFSICFSGSAGGVVFPAICGSSTALDRRGAGFRTAPTVDEDGNSDGSNIAVRTLPHQE